MLLMLALLHRSTDRVSYTETAVMSKYSGTADHALELLAVSDFSQAEAARKADCWPMALSCAIYRPD